MKAKTIFTKNWKEIEQAQELGYSVPEPEYGEDWFYFSISKVEAWHYTTEGDIKLYMDSGETWKALYDKDLEKWLITAFT